MKELNAILEHINNLVVVLSEEGDVSYVSPSVKKILGFEPAEVMGSRWWEQTTFLEEPEKVRVLAINKFSALKERQFERQLRTSLGGSKWILWNSVEAPDGKIIGIGSDITEKKNTELRLEQNNLELQLKSSEVQESLDYAQRLQQTILPELGRYQKSFTDAFVLFQPKDTVSGDFHWIYESETDVVVAAVDCTGHGVPGAMVSIVGNGLLRNLVIKTGLIDPAEILYALDEEVQLAMTSNSTTKAKDGMDVALISINKKTKRLSFAGAFNSLFVVRNGELEELKGARYPIGFFDGIEKEFIATELQLETGDQLYLSSDGYPDQFGGERNKKFNKKKFKELLQSLGDMSMDDQQKFLEYVHCNWRQDTPQTDDILVMGLKVW